jgi:hypothetical protein
MIEREFDTNEIADVFYYIDHYLFSIRESKREKETDSYRKFWENEIPHYREWLGKALGKYSLDYTIEEIEEQF